LFSLLIFLPVFLSFDSKGVIAFNRVIGGDYNWIATVPISIIISLVFLAYNSRKVIKTIPKNSLLFLAYLCVSILVMYFGNEVDFSAIKTAVFMAIFICLLYGFKFYFGRILDRSVSLKRAENKYILYPLSLILLATLLSNFFIIAEPHSIPSMVTPLVEMPPQPFAGAPGEISPFAGVPEVIPPGVTSGSAFLTSNITIYNFEQYFSFVFILLLAVAARLKFYYFFIITIASLYLAVETENRSALVMMGLICVYYLIDKITTPVLNDFFYKIVRTLIIIFPILYLIIMYVYVDVNTLDRSLYARYGYVQGYFHQLHWYQMFLPISDQARQISADMHNEILEIFNATALPGLIGYYYFIYNQIKNFSSRFKMQSISLLLLIFIGGTMTGNTTHMYLLVILTYFIAFYVVISHKEKELIDKSVMK
jgi:hypothetical protein